jgi:hypothetical protein
MNSIQNTTNIVGCVITNLVTGSRTKVENPVYAQKKILRGNNANLQYQYLCLRRINNINEVLYYFPGYKRKFKKYSKDIETFISNLHQSYITHFVRKLPIKISNQYLRHIYKIHHEIYLPSLTYEMPIIIRKNIVRGYFDQMEPREQLYHLTYTIRREENDSSL